MSDPTPLSTPAAQGTVAEPTSFIWTDELHEAFDIMGIPVNGVTMHELSALWRGLNSAAQFASPSPEALPASGVDREFTALRIAYKRGVAWASENPDANSALVEKAAYDYADKATAALTSAPAPEDRR